MIEILSGKIGGGKSYTAVERIVDHVSKGGVVYTNIELVYEGVAKAVLRKARVHVERDQLRSLPENVYGWHMEVAWGSPGLPTLVVIDEAHLWYNARDWAKNQAEHGIMFRFLTQSRKAWVDLILITQVPTTLDKQFRDNAEFVYDLMDMSKAPFPLGWFVGGSIYYVKKHSSGEVFKKGLKRKSQLIFDAYDTYAFLDEANKELAEKAKAEAEGKRDLRKATLIEMFKIYW